MSISVRELLEAGAHFGHQTHRWNPKMRPFIFGARNGIHIIDLQKTARLWGSARDAVKKSASRGEVLLFVGTKPQAQDVVEEEAARCSQNYVNRRWLGGMLTNFKTIKSRLERLETIEEMKTSGKMDALQKKEALLLEKERIKLERGLCGIKTMKKLPGLIVIVDPKKEQIAVREAKKLQIPIIAITDTNCNPEGIEYVIPANDDALKSIRLFLAAIADASLEGKKVHEQRIQEEARRRAEAEKKRQEEQKAASEAAAAAGEGVPQGTQRIGGKTEVEIKPTVEAKSK